MKCVYPMSVLIMYAWKMHKIASSRVTRTRTAVASLVGYKHGQPHLVEYVAQQIPPSAMTGPITAIILKHTAQDKPLLILVAVMTCARMLLVVKQRTLMMRQLFVVLEVQLCI